MTNRTKTAKAKRSTKPAPKKAKPLGAASVPQAATLPPPILIPLTQLVEMPERNARKTRLDNVDDLVPSIRAQGLLQNLVVVAKDESTFGVVAGERRRRALVQLVGDGSLPAEIEIACVVVEDADAYEASLAENEQRLPMHPADQFEAFLRLINEGKTVEEVAAHFNVTPAVVRQRLRLASVAPEFLDLYRNGKATLDQLIALSITSDHERQRSVWNAARTSWQREPSELRAALAQSRLNLRTSNIAKYVSLATYEKAGGGVERDLFSKDVFLVDVGLVERLALEKLERKAAKLREAEPSWGWIETRLSVEYRELHQRFRRLQPGLRALTDAERAELNRLAERNEDLGGMIESSEGNDEAEEAIDAMEKEYAANVRRAEQIEEGRKVQDAAVNRLAGVVIYIDDSGNACIERGLIKPADVAAVRVAAEKKHHDGAGGGEEDGGVDAPAFVESTGRPKDPNGLSDALARRLSIERTCALRAALAESPRVAFVALVHALILQEFRPWARSAVSIMVSDAPVRGVQAAGEEGKSLAETKRSDRHNRLAEALPQDDADALWSWTLEQPTDVLMEYLAHCVSEGVNAVVDRGGADATAAGNPIAASHQLARAIGFEMADWWSATTESYFGSVSKALIVEAVKDAKGEAIDPMRFEKMKKGEAIAAAAAAIAGTRWLPPALRTL